MSLILWVSFYVKTKKKEEEKNDICSLRGGQMKANSPSTWPTFQDSVLLWRTSRRVRHRPGPH